MLCYFSFWSLSTRCDGRISPSISENIGWVVKSLRENQTLWNNYLTWDSVNLEQQLICIRERLITCIITLFGGINWGINGCLYLYISGEWRYAGLAL